MPDITHHLSVCIDCMLTHANGETDGRPGGSLEPQPWALWVGETRRLAMGTWEHHDECTPEDREVGCDCGDEGYSTSRCDGCGTTMHGDRFRFVAFNE